jgi:hypothetical protein
MCSIFPLSLGVFLLCVFLWCPWYLLWCRICVLYLCDLSILSCCYYFWCALCIWYIVI